MDAFSYLSVLLSIIIGLSITQVLQGYRALLLARSRVRLYAPTLIWSALILLIATQNWWASFGLATHHEWTFAAFSVVLLQTIVLYMIAALVLPDMPADATIDLAAHYARETTPFFTLFITMLGVSIVKDWLLDHHLTPPVNLAFHGLFASLGLLALIVRRRWADHAVAILATLLILVYVALLFARL